MELWIISMDVSACTLRHKISASTVSLVFRSAHRLVMVVPSVVEAVADSSGKKIYENEGKTVGFPFILFFSTLQHLNQHLKKDVFLSQTKMNHHIM